VESNEPTLQSGLDMMLIIRFIGQGKWEQLRARGEKALATLDRQPRAYRVRGNLLTLLSLFDHFQARYTDQLEKSEMIGQLGRISNNMEFQSWNLDGLLMIHTALGQFTTAQADMDKLQRFLPGTPKSGFTDLFFQTDQAKLALALQQSDKAEAHTEQVAQLLSRSPFPIYMSLFGETICAEVPLTQWRLAGQSTDPAKIKRWRASAKQACRALAQFARIYPIGKPDALRCQGDYDWLNGKPAQAQQNWQASLQVALQMSMPRQVALAHWSLGYLPGPEQFAHRQAAREILEGSGALAYFEYLEMTL
jgi:tetratricopeptide (TPR) repeat protein